MDKKFFTPRISWQQKYYFWRQIFIIQHTLVIMPIFQKKLKTGNHCNSGFWETHKIYSIITWSWLAKLILSILRNNKFCLCLARRNQSRRKKKKKSKMAAQRPYRQRKQYLTPTAWELNCAHHSDKPEAKVIERKFFKVSYTTYLKLIDHFLILD